VGALGDKWQLPKHRSISKLLLDKCRCQSCDVHSVTLGIQKVLLQAAVASCNGGVSVVSCKLFHRSSSTTQPHQKLKQKQKQNKFDSKKK
jgi:hypothetical protein